MVGQSELVETREVLTAIPTKGMVDPARGKHLIFVGGAPRSGTTLLQNMLDSHPSIYGGPEFTHLPEIIQLRNSMQRSIEKEWIDVICSMNDLDHHIGSLIENFFEPLLQKNGCTLVSEKTPENVMVFPELIKIFPGARFVNIVRDPRAVVSSLLEVGKRAAGRGRRKPTITTTIQRAISIARRSFLAGLNAAELAPDRVLTVSYEKLVTDSKSETRRICEFLRLGWSARMLQPGRFKHPGEKAITSQSDEIWYDRESYNRNPDDKHMHKWRTLLSGNQQHTIALAFKGFQKELKAFGYDLSLDRQSPLKHLAGGGYSSLTHVVDLVVRAVSFSRTKLRRAPSSKG